MNCKIVDFKMKSLNNRERKVRIFTPKNYDIAKRYPVIYMHDGQNLFDDASASYGKSWNIASNFNEYEMEYIVVGIDSGEGLTRMDELSPWRNEWLAKTREFDFITRPCGGEGEKYIQFIIEELKPWVDSNYNTLSDREHTCIAGSSMGGLLSFYCILTHPEVFSKAVCLSSSFWFSEDNLIDLIRNYNHTLNTKIYLDFGSQEVKDPLENEYLVNFVKVLNYKVYQKGISSKFNLSIEGEHNEASWEKSFPGAVKWLFSEEE